MRWPCFCCDFSRDRPFALDETYLKQHKCHTGLPLQVIMRGMTKGTFMYKVRSTTKWYRRRYCVDIQNMRLAYRPSRKRFWCDKKTAFDLYEIEEIRKGCNTDIFNKLEAKMKGKFHSKVYTHRQSMLKEENCFSVVFGGVSRMIVDLIAPNIYTRDAWVRGLNHLLATCKSIQKKEEYDRWLIQRVKSADVNNNGYLNFNECLTLLNQLNISMDKLEAKQIFDASNFRKVKIDGEDALEPDEFVHFYHKLLHRPEIEELMRRYSVSKTTMIGAEELQTFLHVEQKMFVKLEDCQIMIDKFEPESEKMQGYLSLEGFQKMLLSVDHNLFNKKHRIIYQDMTHPLNHYYVASSHNTYLMQGQIIGESSIEGYITALQRGCRCLELDTWDGLDGEPVIFHGYTLTSRILFKDVLEAIKQYAFRASQYPVILSIENHCSVPQQIQMAKHLVNILGEYLYKDPILEEETCLPSPETLARKIMIKHKKMEQENVEEEEIFEEENFQEEEILQQELAAGTETAISTVHMAHTSHTMNHPRKLVKNLSDLVNYFKAVTFVSFKDCKKKWKFNEMSSFKETDALNLASDFGKEFVSFNKHHFSRIYPKGLRTESSNPDPIPFWNIGCQMVALNYQTWDESMLINEKKFAQNGKCGYVLKPKFLYHIDDNYDPGFMPDEKYQKYLIIKVISGQHIPKPGNTLDGEVVDPYVSVKVFGHTLDAQKKKTKYISNNGFNPMWNEKLMFILHQPELAMLSFWVKDNNTIGKNAILGQSIVPFTSITEGFRHIHLEDMRGQPLVPATLFVHVTIVNHEKR